METHLATRNYYDLVGSCGISLCGHATCISETTTRCFACLHMRYLGCTFICLSIHPSLHLSIQAIHLTTDILYTVHIIFYHINIALYIHTIFCTLIPASPAFVFAVLWSGASSTLRSWVPGRHLPGVAARFRMACGANNNKHICIYVYIYIVHEWRHNNVLTQYVICVITCNDVNSYLYMFAIQRRCL